MESGCRVVQIDRDLFLRTIVQYPRVLQSYLNRYIARLWRVGHFTLHDFLQLPLETPHLVYNNAVSGAAVGGGAAPFQSGCGGGGDSLISGGGLLGTGGNFNNNSNNNSSVHNAPQSSHNMPSARPLSDEHAITLAEAVLVRSGEDQSMHSRHDPGTLLDSSYPPARENSLPRVSFAMDETHSPAVESSQKGDCESAPMNLSTHHSIDNEDSVAILSPNNASGGIESSYRHWRALNAPPGLKGVLESTPPTAAQALKGGIPNPSALTLDRSSSGSGNITANGNYAPSRGRPLPPRPSSAGSETTAPSPSAFSRFMQPLQGILRSSKRESDLKPITKSQRRVSFSEDQMAAAMKQSADVPAPIKSYFTPATRNLKAMTTAGPTATATGGSSGPLRGGLTKPMNGHQALPNQHPSSPVDAEAPSLPVMLCTHYASLAGGWDVVAPEESGLGVATLVLLTISVGPGLEVPQAEPGIARRASLAPGEVLYDADASLTDFYVLLEGNLVIERSVPGKKRTETALVLPGSLVGGASFLTSTHSRCKVWAAGEGCLLAAVGQNEIEGLVAEAEVLKATEAALPEVLPSTEVAEGRAHAIPASASEEDADDAESVDSMHTAQEGSSRPGSASSINSMFSAQSSAASNGPLSPPPASPTRGPFSPLPPLPASPSLSQPATSPWEAIPAGPESSSYYSHQFSSASGQHPRTISNQSPRNSFKDAIHAGAVVADLLLAASRALGPVIRQFISLGLSRTWYRSGEVVYRAGESAEALYIVISGRARLLYPSSTGEVPGSAGFRVEDDVGRGESMGAVWAVAGGTHDTTCLCVRDVEAVRMSKASFEVIAASRPKAAARLLQGMAARLAAAGASRRVAANARAATLGAVGSTVGAGGKRGDIATIAILSVGTPRPGTNPGEAVAQLARILRSILEASTGPTTLLDFSTVQAIFPIESQQLEVPFFRAKVTTWLSQKEEDCRFIILQGEGSDSAWTRICADQADCILLTAVADGTSPEVSLQEDAVVWRGVRRAAVLMHHAVSSELDLSSLSAFTNSPAPDNSKTAPLFSHQNTTRSSFDATAAGDVSFTAALQQAYAGVATAAPGSSQTSSFSKSAPFAEIVAQNGSSSTSSSLPSPASLRRVELVLLHPSGSAPQGTAAWLDSRPLLTRHHHVDLLRPETIERLGRWMSGTAVGVVLSGGGSRGLAHVGVLRALRDASVPIDVIGGSSQGAMIGGIYAQDIGFAEMHAKVRAYAAEMGSARRLFTDLTLPLLSVFTGAGLDSVVKQAFSQGPQRIEDLWVRFFCVTTNLTLGAPSVHQRGVLWRAVRASMTLIGLVPPVVDESGHLLCDGGYSDNLPVSAMRDQVGVGSVIVVDVEDRDQSAWHNLSSTDGGVSGWQLLWDRICPVERWRFGIRMPGHAAMMNALTWMAHKQNLARLAQEGQQVDLYLRPPVTQYRLMDYHLADRIVRDASRYAFVAVADWQRRHGGRVPGQEVPAQKAQESSRAVVLGGMPLTLKRRSASVGCMTQLQAKTALGGGLEEEESSEDGASAADSG